IYQVAGGLLSNVLGSISLTPSGIIGGSLDASLAGLATIQGAVYIGDALNHPLVPYFDATGIKSAINKLKNPSNLSLDDIITGTDKVLGVIEGGLKSDLISKIPVIGDGLDLGGTFIGELRRDFLQPLKQLLDNQADGLKVAIQKLIFDELG